MLKIKNPKLAFAIRYNESPNKNVVAKSSLYDLMNHISGQYPAAKFEGITSPKRASKKVYDPLVEFGGLALTKVKLDKRNLICVGVSDKYDVSFEKEGDILTNVGCGLKVSNIPVLDIEKDANEIIRRLAAYFTVVYPLTSMLNATIRQAKRNLQPQGGVKFHSSFVQVGNRAMTYETYRSMQQPKVEVTEKVTMPGAPNLVDALLNLLR